MFLSFYSDASSLEIMFTDLALLLLFTIQHSVMASDWWKFAVYELGLSVINRTVYLGCTSSALQVDHLQSIKN